MASENGVFGEITRIERDADAILQAARAKAAGIRKQCDADRAALAEQTDREVEHQTAELADEYKSRTEQTLTRIDVEFLKQQETLEGIRQERFDELAGWAAARIRERQQTPSSTDGD